MRNFVDYHIILSQYLPLKRTPCTAALLSNLGTVVSLISSIMEPEVGVVKGTCAKPERRRVTMANRLLWEMVWVQNGTNHVDFYSHRRCCAVSDSQNGIWRNQNTGSEIGYSMMVFPRSETGLAILTPLQIVNKSYQTGKIILWNQRNLEHVKTQKWL